MSDHDALLAAVCAAPLDDLPRLVYADWLDDHVGEVVCPKCRGTGGMKFEVCTTCGSQVEYKKNWNQGNLESAPACPSHGWRSSAGIRLQGDCQSCEGTGRVSNGHRERAEFIRVQVELARSTCEPGLCILTCRCDALQRRERELFDAHAYQWFERPDGWLLAPHAGDLAAGTNWLVVRRGFVAEVRCPLATWVGGPCGRCEGLGSVSEAPFSVAEVCPRCLGIPGWRTLGVGPAMVASHPIETVVLIDREPARETWSERGEGGETWTWYVSPHWDAFPESYWLPNQFELLAGVSHPTRDTARDALSAEAIQLAKAAHQQPGGLP